MASITYVFTVRDSSVTTGENRKTGLTPTFSQFKKLSDNTSVSAPAITEIGLGAYKFSYDSEATGETAWQIDAGNTLANYSDRYIDGLCTIDSSRISANLDAQVSVGNASAATAATQAATAATQATGANTKATAIQAKTDTLPTLINVIVPGG